MKRLIQHLRNVVAFIAVLGIFSPVSAEALDLSAKSAIVIEAGTGKVLYERGADERRPPASTTKVMTLIVALENGKLDDIVTSSEHASTTEGSTMWLAPGERMKMLDLLYGIMLVSGNDATVAVAEHISGSVPKFSNLMNAKAAAIGAKGTNFTNPNGLPEEKHYSTARDLARITAYGYNNLPLFGKIVGTINKTMPWPGKDHDRDLYNENKLLWMYEGGNGVKTGYTEAAGRCLVSAANRNGVQLIAVVLDADQMWTDSMKLLDYGFKQVSAHKVVKQGDILKTVSVKDGKTDKLALAAATDVTVASVPGDRDKFTTVIEVDKVAAPVVVGQKIGKVKVLLQGQEVASTDLVATQDVQKKSFFGMLWGSVWNVLTFMIKNFA